MTGPTTRVFAAETQQACFSSGVNHRYVHAAAKRSAWRAHDALKVLRRLLSAAVDAEAIARNPATRVATPRLEQGRPWVLTMEEVSLAERSNGKFVHSSGTPCGCHTGGRTLWVPSMRITGACHVRKNRCLPTG